MEDKEGPKKRNPDWTRDEMLLALNYYLQNRGRPLNKNSATIAELTREIGSVARVLGLTGDERLRNVNGVTMKIENFKARDPDLIGRGRKGLTAGNAMEAVLWEEFGHRPDELAKIVAGIIVAVDTADAPDDMADADYEAPEGRLLVRVHQKRERNRSLVLKKKRAVLKEVGHLRCTVCDFDFGKFYGPRGQDFLECHHTVPVSSLGENATTKLSDLALVCANCHRMIHAGHPWWTIEEAREAIAQAAQAQ